MDKIDKRLKKRIIQTRGNLFTEQRPNLSDHQQTLCEQMEVMLTELEAKESPSINRAGFNPQAGRQPQAPFRQNRLQYGGFPCGQPFTARPARGNCPYDTFYRCYEAGRSGPASKTHLANSCPYPPNRRSNQL